VFNKPTQITQTGISTSFEYGPDRQRFYQQTDNNGTLTTTRYYSSDYEQVQQGNSLRDKITIGDYLVIARVTSTDNGQENGQIAEDLDYLHRDHLGSVEATSDRFGQFTGRFAFDPWGQRRQDSWEDFTPADQATIDARTFASTTKGFTNHEHLDAVGLIHMNGRVYDPLIGRFLSPDDYVQFPETSQSYNRYTYVLNNPLSYTDPGGEIIFTGTAIAVIWTAIKIYDIATTAYETYQTISDDKLTTGEKALELTKQVAMAAIPLPKIITKTAGAIVGSAAKKFKPKAANKSVGGKKSQEGSGSDVKTEKIKENKEVAVDEKVAKGVPDSTIVCRGGACKADSFTIGSGVTTDAAEKLAGVATGIGDSVTAASKNIPHKKVGVTTAGDIRAAGGKVVNDRGNHANVSGVTAQQAEDLFENVVKNPNK
jgi:RHS repeat-associated protein